MANKFGSNRVGWNQRGPTNKELLRDAQARSNPDSLHWQHRTHRLRDQLIDIMGGASFKAWADRLLPDDVLEQTTWKQIAELYEYKLHVEEGVPTQAEIERHDWVNDPKYFKIQGD